MNSISITTTLRAAQTGDEGAYRRLVEPHRAELHAHCYRMLGSFHDAEDALQDALLRAWRGLARFEGRSSLRSWLFTIATNACLTHIARRPKRVLPVEYGPAADPHDELAPPLAESVWLDAYPLEVEDGFAAPEASYERRESVELAFVAALQHLPPRQRAVLILREVLGFAPREIADALETTPASVYSALQRAHAAVDERLPERSQQATLRALGDERLREVVQSYVNAWEKADVEAIRAMLTEDAVVAMPPRPTWFRGPDAAALFLASRPFAGGRRWQLQPATANAQIAFTTIGRDDIHTVQVLTLAADGRISDITAFLKLSQISA